MSAYSDIRHAARPAPCKPRMPRQNRAKIFAPYNALKEFQPAVRAKETLYVRRRELSEYAQELLDTTLQSLKRTDTVNVTWFCPRRGCSDPDTGQYMTQTGTVEKIDPVFRVLVLDHQRILFSDIQEIRRENHVRVYDGRVEQPAR